MARSDKERIKYALDTGIQIWEIPFRDKVLLIKKENRYTQDQMAAMLNVSRTSYGSLERGEHGNPSYATGVQIDQIILEMLYDEQPTREEILKQVSTLFKCLKALKSNLTPGTEAAKYANMALKCAQTVGVKLLGKGEK